MRNKQVFIALLGATILVAPSFVAAQTTPVSPAPSGAALTRIEERLNDMEQQLRTMTGKLEEAQFATAQLQKNQDNQLGDMQRRIQDLEVRLNTVGANTVAVPSTTEAPEKPAPVTNKAATIAPAAAPDGAPPPPAAVPNATSTNPADPNAPLASSSTVKPLGSVSADGKAQPGTPEAEYEAAFQLIKDNKYAEAETAFRAFIKTNPSSDLTGNAQYWLGESYYAREKYKEAAKAFAEGYQKYRSAPKAADNLLKLALSLQALGSTDDACVTFKQFKSEYKDAASSLKAKADAEMAKISCK